MIYPQYGNVLISKQPQMHPKVSLILRHSSKESLKNAAGGKRFLL